MRVGFNAHLLPRGSTYRSAGVAGYVAQLMARLPRVAPENQYLFFTPPGFAGEGLIPSRLPTWRPLVRISWEQVIEPVQVRRLRVDVVHHPVNASPLLDGPGSVVTLHDLAFLKFPEAFTTAKRTYLRLIVKASVLKAARVITPSQSSRLDVIEHFGAQPEKVVAVPLGVDEHYRRVADMPSPFEGPFILYVGTIEPRKNLPRLLGAFARLRAGGYPHRLVMAGPLGWMYQEVYRAITSLDLQASVVILGFVEDLLPWYNSADLFVYPSVYEGFGLPPLEAMACGTPVVTTSAGSLREVVGNAALLVAPDDEAGLLTAMESVLADSSLADRLRREGEMRSRSFSWDQTARETARVYEAVGRIR